MSDNTGIIADTTTRIFRELGDGRQRSALWRALDDAALVRAWIAEEFNGAGATLADGFEVIKIAGAHAVDVPLPETMLGGWLLEKAKIAAPECAITVAPVDMRDRIVRGPANRLSGTARAVPFAREAERLIVLVSGAQHSSVASIAKDQCELTEHSNLAGDPRDTVTLKEVVPEFIQTASIDFDAVMLMGAAIRSVQMAGALQTILDLSVAYANERVAFEKPIGKFQSIQHSLARLAGEAAAAIAAAGSAADAIHSLPITDEAVFFEVAAAKIRIGEAVATGAAIAHQVHGAIGFSQEHPLHRYTQRLWAWRDDFGTESYWAVQLGQRVAKSGADKLWPMLAAR